jgi:hypothetical protein
VANFFSDQKQKSRVIIVLSDLGKILSLRLAPQEVLQFSRLRVDKLGMKINI